MSISAARPAQPIDRSVVAHSSDGRKIIPSARHSKPFSRTPGTGATVQTGHVHSVGPTPLKPFATAFCRACTGLRQKLEHQGVSNPTYLGSEHGSWVYSDARTGQAGVRNVDLGDGPFGLGDIGNTCVIKPDGRVIFNGETLAEGHPDLPRVEEALQRVFQKVSDDELQRRSFIGGNTLQPPWEPTSLVHGHYAP